MRAPPLHPGALALAAVLAFSASPGEPASAGTEAAVLESWSPPQRIATGKAIRGPWRQNESAYDWVDDPAVALAPDGTVAVAWVDQGRKDVLLQRFDPEGRPRFAAPTNVSRSPAVFSWLPRVVLLSGGHTVCVLWQEIVFSGGSHGGEIYFARSTDGGRTFSAPANLSRSTAGDGKGRLDARTWDNGSLDLAAGEGGALVAAWTEYQGALWVRRSDDEGATFSPPLRLAGTGDARPARGPSLAAGPGATVALAFTVGEDPSADVRVALSRDGGRSFGPPRVAARTPGRSDAPRIAFDRAGAVHLVFAEHDRGRAARVLYARAEPGTLEFSAPRVLHDGRRQGEGAVFPDLAIAADGSIWAMSELLPAGAERPRGLQLSVSEDGGRTFSRAAPIPGSEGRGTIGGEQGRFLRRLAVDAHEVVVGLSTFQRGVASEILLLRARRP